MGPFSFGALTRTILSPAFRFYGIRPEVDFRIRMQRFPFAPGCSLDGMGGQRDCRVGIIFALNQKQQILPIPAAHMEILGRDIFSLIGVGTVIDIAVGNGDGLAG